ncbi:MAG TPA: bifunctional riboflavin kinase/FAD synthetase [Terriglobia bacterium]|nr:bifunctional riboflavin kinase/FAD synthetase [Terriglobia bacterium]
MQVIRDLQQISKPLEASVVTIGNFDGVHLAHQQLLKHVMERARCSQALAAAVTFEPHPIKLLAPHRAPKVLTALDRKIQLIGNLGMDEAVVLPFTRELAHLSPSDFVDKILRERLSAIAVIVGPNFRFGYRQAGDVNTLAELGRERGFEVEVVSYIEVRGQRVSSTRIRELLAAGRVHTAGRLLGRPFSNFGPIAAGRGVGRKQTVPTVNFAPVEEQLPGTGVYVTRTRLDSGMHQSVTNVGYKPTFGDLDLSVETYLLNFQGEIHEKEVEIEYLHRLRDEIKFQNPEMLKIQIQEDVRRSRKFFRMLKEIEDRLGKLPGLSR